MLPGSWVVIAAHNEATAIRLVVQGVREITPRVVVVDDGSEDATAAEAVAAGATVLKHAVNLGQGAALQTGIQYALSQGAAYVFTFDADGQHAPESLCSLADAFEKTRVDVVLGSRTLGKTDGMPAFRRALLKAAVVFTRLHTGLRVTDTHNGLRLITRAAAERIRLMQPRMAHASEILSQIRTLGLSYTEAPVSLRYTQYSLGKGQSAGGAFRILLDLIYKSWTR